YWIVWQGVDIGDLFSLPASWKRAWLQVELLQEHPQPNQEANAGDHDAQAGTRDSHGGSSQRTPCLVDRPNGRRTRAARRQTEEDRKRRHPTAPRQRRPKPDKPQHQAEDRAA